MSKRIVVSAEEDLRESMSKNYLRPISVSRKMPEVCLSRHSVRRAAERLGLDEEGAKRMFAALFLYDRLPRHEEIELVHGLWSWIACRIDEDGEDVVHIITIEHSTNSSHRRRGQMRMDKLCRHGGVGRKKKN